MPNHKGTVRIETERLVLRRFVPEDMEQIFENCWSDYEVWKWTNYALMNTLDDVKTRANMFTENWLRAYERPDRYSWAMELKETGEVIGRFFGMHPDDAISQVELAYEMGRKWWNQGLMTEAAKAVIHFFIAEVGFGRVYAYHAAGNPASGAVMKKCGRKYEGTLRCADKNNQGICDVSYYGILKSER